MTRSIDSEERAELEDYASDSQEESESEYAESSVDLSDGSQVVNLASPRASVSALATALDDDNDVQILTPAEAAAELAAAARRAIADPEGSASRKRKRPAVETKAEPTECTVCCENCTLVGRHRLVALRCGHLFGKKCIERWIGERRTCPNCSAGVKRTDIFTLFSDHVAVVDNSGLEDMTTKFEAEKLKSNKLEKELVAMRKQREAITSEATQLKADLNKFKKYFADLRLRLEQQRQRAAAAANGSGQAAASAALLSMSNDSPRKSPLAKPVLPAAPTPLPSVQRSVNALTAAVAKYKPVLDLPLLSARVFGLTPSCRLLCVGEKLADESHGILLMSTEDPRGRTQVAVHSSDIRDLCFQQSNSYVLTVAFDGKLAVTSLRDQKVVLQVELPPGRRQGWSCSFSGTDPNAMFCGFQDGSVDQYDMRKPGIVRNFALPESQPVHSLKAFTSRDSTESLAAATFRGLSVWKDVNQPVVGNGSVRVTPFCHAAIGQAGYSLASNQLNPSQVVVSTRSTPIVHSLFNLRTLHSGQLRPRVELVGHQAPSVLSRSALWSEADGTSILASWSHDVERVTLRDLATLHEARGPEPPTLSVASASMPVVDIQHAVANGTWSSGTALLGTMTSRQLCLYRRTP